MTTRKEKIDLNIPKKRVGSTTRHDKVILVAHLNLSINFLESVARFFEAIMASILKHIQFKVVKCIILASPGFVKVNSSYNPLKMFYGKLRTISIDFY